MMIDHPILKIAFLAGFVILVAWAIAGPEIMVRLEHRRRRRSWKLAKRIPRRAR